MLDHKEPDSFVIGLYGGWGVGKTSVINMVVEELLSAGSNMADDEKPIILNFSAWSYSGQNNLVYSFFRRLSSALRGADYLENNQRIIHLLELYVSFFTHKPVPKALRTKRSWWQIITRQGHEEIYAWESGRDLTLVKAELNRLLREQKHKIIIIIDNISRLGEHEINQIFQIVKSMGDYANTCYLLAFDKEQVAHALAKIGGNELIEKIVQLPFAVPPISPQDLESIFADRLRNLMNTVPQDSWKTEYWADIYYGALRHLFKNCRDITRYVNTLSFSYPRLRDVVNPVDFFALSAIEVFFPHVYFGIRDNKDLFTDLLDHVYVFDRDQMQKDKIRCDEIIQRCGDKLQEEFILELLTYLFPRIRKIYRPSINFYYSEITARSEKRICSPDLFDIYFRLSMQPGQIPKQEFETLLKLTYVEDEFDHALTRLNQDERIIKFLDEFDSNILYKIPRENISVVVNALLNNGDLFPQGISDMLSISTPLRIHRIIHTLLQRLPSEERFITLQTAIAKSNNSIYIIVHELREQIQEHTDDVEQFIPVEFRDLTPEQLTLLKKFACTRIESWSKTNRLESHPKLIAILDAWLDWGDEIKCREYVHHLVQTDRGLVIFLQHILDDAISETMSTYHKQASWNNYLEHIRQFISTQLVEERAKAIFEDSFFEKLSEREQLAIMIFLDLTKTNTNKIIPDTGA
jgi:predicted KAP-like P-loop ATPase